MYSKKYNVFANIKFARGSGLGNRLFPWARAYLFSKKYGSGIISPSWINFRRGPLLRGGKLFGGIPFSDLLGKIYLVGNFSNQGYIGGHEKSIILSKGRFISEDEFSNFLDDYKNKHLTTREKILIVDFEGDGNHFIDLKGMHLEIKNEMLRIASRSPSQIPSAPIVINVRLGRDFKKPKSREDLLRLGGIRTPVEWYANALDLIRNEVGEKSLPALVVSDGRNSELTPLLKKNNVSRYISHRAIQDLIALSQAKHIIGTGGSSFTAWGCFLSQANVVTVEGQSMNWFGLSAASSGSIRTLGLGD